MENKHDNELVCLETHTHTHTLSLSLSLFFFGYFIQQIGNLGLPSLSFITVSITIHIYIYIYRIWIRCLGISLRIYYCWSVSEKQVTHTQREKARQKKKHSTALQFPIVIQIFHFIFRFFQYTCIQHIS